MEASRLRLLRGPRAAEEALFEDLEERVAGVRLEDGPQELARPIRVVVPSNSLRLHLSRRFLLRRGRPLAGVVLQTLHAAAREILGRHGQQPAKGQELLPMLAERFAREEEVLHRRLDSLLDGYRSVAATVRDLLDAGLEPALSEGLEEAALASGASGASGAQGGPGAPGASEARQRAAALVRVATNVHRALELMGLGNAGDDLRRARRYLEADAEASLPSRAILIFGFADATGSASELLESLLRHGQAWFYLDLPPDPAAAAPETAEDEFPQPLRERLRGAAAQEEAVPAAEPRPARIRITEAADPATEALLLTKKLRAALEEGVLPEDMAVVARDPGPYETLLCRLFDRFAIPFSMPGARGSRTAVSRRVAAALEILRQGGRTSIDRWLEARTLLAGGTPAEPGQEASLKMELRLAFHSLGAGRLHQAIALELPGFAPNQDLPLPLAVGFEEDEEDSQGGSLRRARRTLSRARFEAAREAARALCQWLESWPAVAPLADHLDRFQELLVHHLGWPLHRTGEPGREGEQEPEPFKTLDQLRRDLPGRLEISRRELEALLAPILEDLGRKAHGGAGGGVQVLSVTEARGRTFERLFLVGLARDGFPRPVREDPLLPDSLRQELRRLLPDLPVKGRGFAEERYLFAQLLASSPEVHLSWSRTGGDGRDRAPSPLLERLRWVLEERGATREEEEEAAGAPALLPPELHAMGAALAGRRDVFGRLWVRALEEYRQQAGLEIPAAGAWGKSLLRVLAEMDPDLRTPEGRALRTSPGPYLGFVGAPGAAADPRRGRLYITHLENTAACPWQTFLGRVLRLEPTPDPLLSLPELSPLLIGLVVHRALEAVLGGPGARQHGTRQPGAQASGTDRAGTLASALRQTGQLPAWPSEAALDRLLRDQARQVLASAGIALAGLEGPLADLARPFLDSAKETLQSAGSPVLGVEVEGDLTLPHDAGKQQIFFRADLVERSGDTVQLTDFKTGSPLSSAKKAETRLRHFRAAVARGQKLQAVAYLLSGDIEDPAAGSPAFWGRYLFLRPDLEEELREAAASAADQELTEAFYEAARRVLDLWHGGVFFPRLEEARSHQEPVRCRSCVYAEACLRGDSGSRSRLVETALALRQRAVRAERLEPLEAAFLAGWDLGEEGS